MSESDVVDRRPIVAGTDGSASALRAVRWAAAEAQRRGAPLRVVSVFSAYQAYGATFGLGHSFYVEAKDKLDRDLAAAGEAARTIAPDIELTTESLENAPSTALIELSGEAQLTVVGSSGLGGFSGMMLGSTAVALAAHGHSPVVVVRAASDDQALPAEGPVVVGVDASPSSKVAIGLAFEAASRRKTALVAVHAWHDLNLETLPVAHRAAIDWKAIEAEQNKILDDALAGYPEMFPDVDVQRVIATDRPAKALLNYAEDAQLLVVGSRGHGEFAGMVLGSISQALIYHAPCPVLVARPDTVA